MTLKSVLYINILLNIRFFDYYKNVLEYDLKYNKFEEYLITKQTHLEKLYSCKILKR